MSDPLIRSSHGAPSLVVIDKWLAFLASTVNSHHVSHNKRILTERCYGEYAANNGRIRAGKIRNVIVFQPSDFLEVVLKQPIDRLSDPELAIAQIIEREIPAFVDRP
jgi:hypothetical protein